MSSGERMYLEEGNAQLSLEHLHRYAIASGFCHGKRVLDAACGSGYGSRVLSEVADRVVGIDIDAVTVQSNQRTLATEKLDFVCGSVMSLPFPDRSFDVVVSFETIEHVSEEVQTAFLSEIKRVLVPGGLLMMSSPDKRFYTDFTGISNPFHVHELYRDEFEKLLAAHFKNRLLARQQVYPVSLMYGACREFSSYVYDHARKIVEAPFAELADMRFDYLFAVCSDGELPRFESSFCLDRQMAVFGAFRGDGAGNASKVYLPRIEQLEKQCAEACNRGACLTGERDALVVERDALAEERDALAEERDALAEERDALAEERDALAVERNALAEERDALAVERDALAADRERILNSTCWRMTAPMRAVVDWFRGLVKQGNVFMIKELRGLVKQCIPYGVMIWWLRAHYGVKIDEPLFHFPGLVKRCRRILKFSLPFGLVMRNRQLSPDCIESMVCPAAKVPEVLRKRVVLVVHEAQRTGAPFLARAMTKAFVDFGYQVKVVLLDGGPLVQDFIDLAEVEFLFASNRSEKTERELVERLYAEGYRDAYLNTTVSGSLAKPFKQGGFKVMTLIHEMDYILRVLKLQGVAREIADYSDFVIAPSLVVSNSWRREGVTIPQEKLVVCPQHNYHAGVPPQEDPAESRRRIRADWNVSEDEKVVLSVGLVERRKGIVQFLDTAEAMAKTKTSVRFVWIGAVSGEVSSDAALMARMKTAANCMFIDFQSNIETFYAASDVFFCSSESDAFPTVILLAIHQGLPVVLADGCTGAADLFQQAPAGLVSACSGTAFAKALTDLCSDVGLYRKTSDYIQTLAAKFDDFTPYVSDLLSLHGGRRVTCIIPNYNYVGFLKDRIDTVLAQRYAVDELIILDDNSSDGSDAVIQAMLPDLRKRFAGGVKYFRNNENRGVFRQWQRGFEEATGEIVWVAEADDLCTPDFVSRLVGFFDDDKVVLAYAQSRVIDEHNTCHAENYRFYTDDLSKTKFLHDYVNPGLRELADGLAVKNTIPNASAVLMRRDAALKLPFDQLSTYKAAGDWLVYIKLAMLGRVAFCATAMNSHRRHSQSVIARMPGRTLQEIERIYELIDAECALPASTVRRMKASIAALDPAYRFADRCTRLMSSAVEDRPAVLVAITEFHYGGGEIFPIRLANGLQSRGCRVHLLSVDREARNADIVEMVDPLVEVIGLPELGDAAGLVDYIRSNGITAASSHIWWSDKAVFAAAEQLPNVRWIFTMHGCYENLMLDPGIDPDFAGLVERMFARANAVVYTADKNLAVVDSLKRLDRTKLVKLNNGVAVPPVTPVKRSDLGIGESDVVLCFAARGTKDKGWEEVISAVGRLNAEGKRTYHALMIGASAYVDGLMEANRNSHVHFLGFRKDLPACILASDVFVLPTYYVSESQPMAIIDALGRGKPVIASDMGEIPGMLMENGLAAGVVLKSGGRPVSVEAFCSAVHEICDGGRYPEYCDGARKLFRRYDMDICAGNYLKLLKGEPVKCEF